MEIHGTNRKEKMIEAIIKNDPSLIPTPASREEALLAAMAKDSCEDACWDDVKKNTEAIAELSVANAKLSEDKIALPKENGVIVQGTVGQFAVSDGKGGITWKTLAEAEEVSY